MASSSPFSLLPETLQDRFRGVLVGLAIGDAFGAPLEAQLPSAPDRAVTELVGGGWLQLAPGEWTDEVELALITVESLLQKQVFDPDDIAQRFAVWYLQNPRVIGEHTRKVLDRIAHGIPWEEASLGVLQEDVDRASSGSLRRSAPLALFFYHSPQLLPVLSAILSRLTHAHPHSEAACIVLNLMLAHLLLGMQKEQACVQVRQIASELPQEVVEILERVTVSSSALFPTGNALEALEVALRSLLHTTRFENALIVACNHGGDAAVVGAVTGALAGALYGQSGIPPRWIEILHQRDRLQRLADQLFVLSQSVSKRV